MGWLGDTWEFVAEAAEGFVDDPKNAFRQIAGAGCSVCRGVASFAGGAAECVGAVAGAAVDISVDAASKAVGLIDEDAARSLSDGGETLAAAIKTPTEMLSDAVESTVATATLLASEVIGDDDGVYESRQKIDETGCSILKNVFGNTITPVRGSIVKVDLALGCASHTGIYIDENNIIEVAEIDGKAVVRSASKQEFMGQTSLVRTGLYMYVAAALNEPLASEEIASRAILACESYRNGDKPYSLLDNNCHRFTRYCITGNDVSRNIWTENEVKAAIDDVFRTQCYWATTGLGLT